MMASLRARLVAAVLAIAAVGLLALAAIVYAEQRSFLLDRADEQHARGGQREHAGDQPPTQRRDHARGARKV